MEGSRHYMLTSEEHHGTLEIKSIPSTEETKSIFEKACRYCIHEPSPDQFLVCLHGGEVEIGKILRECSEKVLLPYQDYGNLENYEQCIFGATFDPNLRVDVKAVLMEAVFIIVCHPNTVFLYFRVQLLSRCEIFVCSTTGFGKKHDAVRRRSKNHSLS